MELTPIKVKGKGGGQKKTWRPPAQQRVAKRPRDDAGDDTGDDGPRRRRFKSKRAAAPIEDLPTEILENIIIKSRNLNFLRSSLRIGYRFSSPSFLTELVKAAFGPTWQVWLGYHMDRTRATNNAARWMERYGIQGDPDFQGDVLACRWVNATTLLDAQQKWYRSNGGPGSLEAEAGHSDPPPSARPRAFRGYLAHATDVSTRFEEDWEAYNASCATVLLKGDGSLGSIGSEDPDNWQIDYVDLHQSVILPARLVCGPFDTETARTLFWLVRGGAGQLGDYVWSWEWTKRGYDHIMSLDDKPLAMVLLMLFKQMGAFEDWPVFLYEQELDKAQELKKIAPQPTDIDTLALRVLWHRAYEVLGREYAFAIDG